MQIHNIKKTCCFVGHRKIEVTPELENKIKNVVEELIIHQNVKDFLFGSMSEFDDLCYEIVKSLKEKYNYIKRIYVRSSYEEISETYKSYLLKSFEDTFYPKECIGAGKLSHIIRNQVMIKSSDFCIFYYDTNYLPNKVTYKHSLFPHQPKSGTSIAFKYAMQKRVYYLDSFCFIISLMIFLLLVLLLLLCLSLVIS